MTNEQKEKIIALRVKQKSYNDIAISLNISINTIKSYCRKIGLDGKCSDIASLSVCKNCGNLIKNRTKCKHRKFCSTNCRQSWWNSNLEQVNKKAIYSFNCLCCNKEFTAYGNKNRKYCSHFCYITNRFKKDGVADE